VLPHQCRCIIFDETDANRCKILVWEGPDAPLCTECEVNHWGPGWAVAQARGFGHRMAPHGGSVLNEYSITSEDE